MKTKHLLTALALPAVFAACTAEDIVTEGVGVGQAQRIALNENFKLDFGGIESRLSAGEPGEAFAYTFEEGDLVGGAIVDSYTGAKEPTTGTANEKIDAVYETQYFVSANQPFKFDGSAWTLEHTMVEGKYMFYYPYNEENNSRGAAKYSIPVMQDLSDKTTGKFNPKAAIEKYSMAVGYQFLDEEDLSASVELAPIFSYARIVMTLDNQYAGGEVEKVVLQSKGKAFKLNGQLDNKKIEAIFRAQAIGKYVNGDKSAYVWGDKLANKEFDWDNHSTTTAFEIAKDVKTFYDEDFNKTSSIIVGKVPAGTKMTKDAQNNHAFETYMVVPAQAMEGDVVVYLYTADGTIYSGTATYKGASLVFNRNTPKKLTVGLSVNNGAVPYVIASQEDWNNSVSMMSKDEIAEFIIADSEFAIDNETKFPKNGKIIVDKVAVSGNNVTMANVWVKDELTVKEGAKLNADPSLVTKKIVNEGEVVFAEIPEVESKALTIADSKLNEFIASNYWINEIENKGTLTVEEGAELTSYDWLIEKDVTTGTGESAKAVKVVGFEVKDADSKTAGIQPTELGLKLTNKKGGIVANAGLITVWGSNEGTINNVGAINIFKNEKTVKDENNKDVTVTTGLTNESREYELVDSEKQIYEVVNEPKIDNAKTGEIRAVVGDLTNKSLIVNEGILSCGNNEGKITNDKDARGEVAVIDAKANSITLITSNTDGKVIVYAMKQENVSVKSGAGIIEYTAGADIVADASIVTDVVATASIKITQGSATDDDANGALKNLKVAADATITVVAPADNALTFSSIEVAEGKKMTLGSSMETATLKVNEKASVIVPKDLTLKVTGNEENFGNEGSIVVTGALVADKVLKEYGGTVLDNGGTGSITWKLEGVDKTLADAKDEYRKAMKTAMANFAKSDYVKETLKYNLKDSLTVNGSGKWGAASYFETWAGTQSDLKAAHAEYVKAYKAKNTGWKEANLPKITEYYTNAVDTLIAKIKDTDEYESDLDEYTIDAPAVEKDEVNFFTATKRTAVRNNSTAEIAVTAKTHALNRFKQYASSDLDLDENTRIVLCTEGSYDNVATYVPDYMFAFEEDNVYKVYADYIAKYKLENYYTFVTLKGIVKQITALGTLTAEQGAKLGTVGERKLYTAIVADNYALYDEALEWNYTDKTIATILSHARGVVNIGATIPNPGN